ncbi:hypothetical protein CTAYLR_005330 [Chrysophaeum taylorii]|uniref:Zinc finger ZPR1-type domain-containing protein n=1 Tax=Chrysophaeum taylorii TaxID=2483200 RepID=A0AAD7U8U2_9STRA|nr:hypothetical protein CTAYLR_005330 [Chrysophaeum taylorii]
MSITLDFARTKPFACSEPSPPKVDRLAMTFEALAAVAGTVQREAESAALRDLTSGRYEVYGEAVAASGAQFDVSGQLELLENWSVRGSLGDGPVIDGRWNEDTLQFTLLYNGSLRYSYDVAGRSWRGSEGDYGELRVSLTRTVSAEATKARNRAADVAGLEAQVPGGNEACRVRHASSVAVPCATCDADDGVSSRLAFFDLDIPNFGRSELVSFSCDDCGYKYNKVRATTPVGAKGRTICAKVVDHRDLSRHVVLSETARVKIPQLDVEMDVEAKYTTLEGLVRAFIATLGGVPIASDGGRLEAADFEAKVGRLLETCGFDVDIEDPAAQSWISGEVETRDWVRTPEQEAELGIAKLSVTPTTAARFPAALSPSSSEGGTMTLMRACEALSAEYTREYVGQRDDGKVGSSPHPSRPPADRGAQPPVAQHPVGNNNCYAEVD